MSSVVLGQQVYVSVEVIARALACPTNDPRGKFGEYPPHYDLHFIIRDMFGGAYGDIRRTYAKRAQLPPHLLRRLDPKEECVFVGAQDTEDR